MDKNILKTNMTLIVGTDTFLPNNAAYTITSFWNWDSERQK